MYRKYFEVLNVELQFKMFDFCTSSFVFCLQITYYSDDILMREL